MNAQGDAAAKSQSTGLNWGHWVMVFVLPILGIVFGIIELGRNPRLGAQLFGITVLAVIVWAAVISANS